MVLDTDTFNEIDDQYAVAHAVASPDRMDVEALYAAPFTNSRSTGPADGMEKSYDEIHRLLGLMKLENKPPVFKGATRYLDVNAPERTAVTDDLIARAMRHGPEDPPLYVVAIGAITNIATALLLEPRLVERIVVVWLGGHAFNWPDAREFNLFQDVPAARVILDSGAPLVLLPCMGVVDRLTTTIPELNACLAGRSKLADYLVEITRNYNRSGRPIWSKVIWDVAATAWLVNPAWVPTYLAPSPLLSTDGHWSFNPVRHFIRVAREVRRDEIFIDVFNKVATL